MRNRKSSIINNKYSLTIGWLYPDLMSTYGDRGNVIVLQKRCEWRNIKVKVERITLDTKYQILNTCNLFFMGGAQDAQQEIVNRDLRREKGRTLASMIKRGIPGLYVCGAYQFLGKYYRTADNKKLPGLGVFPLYTENPGEKSKRLIGNIVVELRFNLNHVQSGLNLKQPLVGFENHGGRTYLENPSMAFSQVLHGYGNNGEDKTEGIMYENSIGSYLHGPILPKNPELTDFLIQKALEVKYRENINLEPLDDMLEKKAKEVIVKRYLT